MSDVWSIFVDKINNFNQNLIRYFVSIIKSIISYGRFFSKSSVEKIEINKLKWELKKEKEKLGEYIYKSNLDDTYNFSNDLKFHEFINKIKKIEHFLNKNNN